MKEPAGEANMTVIVVVLIGIIVAVGMIIVPKAMARVKFRACCTETGGYASRCPDAERRDRICCIFPRNSERSARISAFNSCASDVNG